MTWLVDVLVILGMFFLRIIAPILLLIIIGDLFTPAGRAARVKEAETGTNAVSKRAPSTQDLS